MAKPESSKLAQPYFPEPLTVSGNVASEKYKDRVQFAKISLYTHFATVVLATIVALFIPNPLPSFFSFWGLLIILVATNISRRVLLTGKLETLASLVGLIISVPLWGWLGVELTGVGVPAWSLALASACMIVYVFSCGRDFSFVGMVILSCIGCWLLLTTLTYIPSQPLTININCFLITLVYLFYLSYDLSMVMKRRRIHEWISSQSDLYRDLLNFVTYPIRVAIHWRAFKWFR